MRFNPKGLSVTATGILVLWAALQTHSTAAVDSVLLIGLVMFVAIASAAIVSARIQGKTVVGQAGAVREILRWLSITSNR